MTPLLMRTKNPKESQRKALESTGRILLPMTGAILCGGKSVRMGRPKAFLPYGGRTLIEHRYQMLQEMFTEVVLVANEPDDYSHITLDVVKDIIPNRGPLVGILSALLVAENEHVFIIACDMPLVDKHLIRRMAMQAPAADVLVAHHEDGVEPLLGIYSKRCIEPLEAAIFEGNLKVADFLGGISAKLFPVDAVGAGGRLPQHFNVNTPQDYSKLLMDG
jgi:molybdopterin-guanine dinucleotide biosynthesis protein A